MNYYPLVFKRGRKWNLGWKKCEKFIDMLLFMHKKKGILA